MSEDFQSFNQQFQQIVNDDNNSSGRLRQRRSSEIPINQEYVEEEDLGNVHRGGFLKYINDEDESRNVNVVKEGNDTIKESLIEGDEDEDDEPQDLEGSDVLLQKSPEDRKYLNDNLKNFISNPSMLEASEVGAHLFGAGNIEEIGNSQQKVDNKQSHKSIVSERYFA